MHKKAKKVAAKENTLAFWAGYEITKDEVTAFKKKLAEVKQPLLKEAASYKGTKVGEAEIYDLGGNVAEFASDGSVYGFSAYDFVDGQDSAAKSISGYTGFRVILE